MANFNLTTRLLLCILLVSITFCSKNSDSKELLHDSRNASVLPVCTMQIVNNARKAIDVHVEIAADDALRQKGLMYRKELRENHGMLFVFQYEQDLHFWMKNTYIPLDIAYISKQGIINETYYMKPLDTSVTYPSQKPALYALEVTAGWFKKNNISPGNRLNFNGCLGK